MINPLLLSLALAMAPLTVQDDVQAMLDKAKVTCLEDLERGKQALLREFQEQINSASAGGDLELVEELMNQLMVFELKGDLPSSRRMSSAAIRYQVAQRQANRALEQAFADAVKDYTREKEIEKAKTIRKQMVLLFNEPAVDDTDLAEALVGSAWVDDSGRVWCEFIDDQSVTNHSALRGQWNAVDKRTAIVEYTNLYAVVFDDEIKTAIIYGKNGMKQAIRKK